MAFNTHSEPAKMEQIITEFFAKSLHIILESRCPYVSSRNYSGEQILCSPSSPSASPSSSMRPRDKWFNLALRECPAALENIDFWRQSNLEPMVVDIVLVQTNWDSVSSKERYPFVWNSDSDEFGCDGGNSRKIIERWVVRYESKKGCKEVCSGSKRSSSSSSHSLYKKSILLLRSLYVTVRLLPAYKIFRDINSTGQIRTFSLVHRVSSFVGPLTRREESEMQQFVFAPVDTSCGKLCVSVSYLPSVSDAGSEPSTPMSPQFIPDYVGSPLADPLKRLPSIPMPQYSPSSSPFGRRHSWSYDTSRISPPTALPSPSPTYSESRASYSKFGSHRPPSSGRPSLETPQVPTKDMSYDEYLPSPIFSLSPSPSPPMHVPGRNISKALLRSDSAPVNIPSSRLGDAPLSLNKTVFRLSPPLKATKPSFTLVEGSSSVLQSGTTAEKLLSVHKEEIGRPSGVKISSSSSPQKSFSRSFSRLSFEDNYDDSEFAGPFVVDDDDTTDPGSRPGSSDRPRHPGTPQEPGGSFPPHKSQDAAVGALVQMLKKAPPLRQDLTPSRHGSRRDQVQEHPPLATSSIASSRVSTTRTTSDALEELKGYKDMKQLLLRQSEKS